MVIPYFHDSLHNLKACAKKFDDDVVFERHFILNRLTLFFKTPNQWKRGHREKSTVCEFGVMYETPMKCGVSYPWQTKICVNDRFTEYKRNIKKQISKFRNS